MTIETRTTVLSALFGVWVDTYVKLASHRLQPEWAEDEMKRLEVAYLEVSGYTMFGDDTTRDNYKRILNAHVENNRK